jgi:hypothetical protein
MTPVLERPDPGGRRVGAWGSEISENRRSE